ncbi:MAG: hypothetical protein ACREUF_03475, partial [Solimonas sp.]
MVSGVLFWTGLAWWAGTMLVQWVSAALALRRRVVPPQRRGLADFSIVAPLAGAHDASAFYIARLAELASAGAQVLICVTNDRDDAIA